MSREYELLMIILRNERIGHGITQTQLAQSLGVSQQLISSAENLTSALDIDHVRRICEVLEIDLPSLMERWLASIKEILHKD
jgi:transcriptional regulator with XRE-family HTH domain